MKENRHIQFWLTLGSLVTMIVMMIFIFIMAAIEQMTLRKEYCLFLLPLLVYSMFQFIVNYGNLIEEKDDRH